MEIQDTDTLSPSTSTALPPGDDNLSLVDYFAVVGFDKTLGLKLDPSLQVLSELSGVPSANERLPPLERAYEANVLSHFPEKRKGFDFPREIRSLCMPKGLRFYTEKNVPPTPVFHSFVVTRHDGTRINGCTLTMFESVEDPAIRKELFNLQMDHVRQITAVERGSWVYDNRTRLQPGMVSSGNHTMPRHVSVAKQKQKRVSYYDSCDKPVFVANCICVLTRIPMVFTAEKVLRGVYDLIAGGGGVKDFPVSLEAVIYWILHEVPLPVPGTTLQLHAFNSLDLVVIRPPANDLPFFDYPLQHLFSYVSVEKFVKLFTCFMLEHQILLCSRHLDRLMLVGESLLTLVFPFRWQLTYVPILPFSQLKFIEAPVPYLMGLCYDDEVPEKIYHSNICILDIDSGRLDHPEDVPPLPKHRQLVDEIFRILQRCQTLFSQENAENEGKGDGKDPLTEDEPAPVPPVVLRRKGIRRDEAWHRKRMSRSFDNPNVMLAAEEAFEKQQAAAMKAGGGGGDGDDGYETASPGSTSPETQKYFQGLRLNQAVRYLFLNYFACLFNAYENFVITGKSTNSRDSVVNFEKASFLADQPDSFLPFLAAFMETQMFASFIDAKILSKVNAANQDDHIVAFDAKIRQVHENSLKTAKTKERSPHLEDDVVSPSTDEPQFGMMPLSTIQMDYVVNQPHELPGTSVRKFEGKFPNLDSKLLEVAVVSSNVCASPWRQNKHRQRKDSQLEESEITTPRKKSPNRNRDSETPDAATKFIEQLLKDAKTKTKRMLVMKMGKEAVHLGHNDCVTGVEENTLVAGFCDLLERVWGHGSERKHGKSALWTHILKHQEREKNAAAAKPIEHSTNLTPEDEASVAGEKQQPTISSSSIDELKESIRQLSKKMENDSSSEANKTQNDDDDDEDLGWSNTFIKAANYLVDKIGQPVDEPPMVEETTGNGRRAATAAARPPRPMTRSSSVTRFASWARNTIRDATATLEAAATSTMASGIVGGGPGGSRAPVDSSTLPPAAPGRSTKVADVNRQQQPSRGFSMHKSSSVSDFAPHWSATGSDASGYSQRPGSSAASVVESLASPRHSRRGAAAAGGGGGGGGGGQERKRSLSSRPRSPMETDRQLTPLPTHIGHDVRSVMEMGEIKTDIGLARAFVRLSLERKLLHKHLKTLFSNTALLNHLYSEQAFLRSIEEREQFLYHILSLNAVDFSCFTHTFITTRMRYEVLFVANVDRFTAPVWIMLTGSLGNTSVITLPSGRLQFTFDHKNLGILSTLCVGQSPTERASKWQLKYALVRNNITGQAFRFNCGRWFGRGVDDGALERLLVAEVLARESPDADGYLQVSSGPPHPHTGSSSIFGGLISRPESPISGFLGGSGSSTTLGGFSRRSSGTAGAVYSTQSLARRNRSTSVTRSIDHLQAISRGISGSGLDLSGGGGGGGNGSMSPRISELHHQLGAAVNALMKHFLTTEQNFNSCAQLTPLLCGENGLVVVIERVFSHGRREGFYSFFQKSYPWDYIDAVFTWFVNFFKNGESHKVTKEHRSLIFFAYQLVRRIRDNSAVGKEGKFHVFILLTLRDHILVSLLPLIVSTPITAKLYSDDAFVRQPTHTEYLSKLLESLNEFNFVLEKSLTYGINVVY